MPYIYRLLRKGEEMDEKIFKDNYTYEDLLYILSRLTGEGGCPWDIVQTHKSIRTNMIEEAYELVAAINANDIDNMIEETGDVLLQALFHADIAARNSEFTMDDVINRLCQKLVSRHTHIFGDTNASTESEALASWDAAKAKEKGKKDLKGQLNELSTSMPSLLYAQKAIKKLTKAGFENTAPSITEEAFFEAIKSAVVAGIDMEATLREMTDDLVKSSLK